MVHKADSMTQPPVPQAWLAVVLLAPLWWLLGFNLFVYHAAAGFFLLALIHDYSRRQKTLAIPFSCNVMAIIIAIYLFSLAVRGVEADPMRVLASLYNLSFWFMGCVLIFVLSNTFHVQSIPGVLRGYLLMGVVAALTFSLIGLAQIAGFHHIVFLTPLYFLTKYLGHTILVENSLLVQPIYWDWFISANWPRFNYLSPYPTATGGLMIMILSMMMVGGRLFNWHKSVAFMILWLFNAAILLMTLSRISVMALGTAMVLVFLLGRKHFIIWVITALLLTLIMVPWIQDLIGWLLSLREGSTLGRLALYRYSLDQLQGVDWVTGLGLKPREEYAFTMPIGSHSTYLSLLYKTGILGTALFVFLQIHLLVRWWRLKAKVASSKETFRFWQGLGLVFLSMSVWMLTQDMDAPQLVCFLYFSSIGMFEGLRRQLSL